MWLNYPLIILLIVVFLLQVCVVFTPSQSNRYGSSSSVSTIVFSPGLGALAAALVMILDYDEAAYATGLVFYKEVNGSGKKRL